MSEVLQANVFFFITSVAVVVFTLFLCVAMYVVIRILQSVRRIVDRIDEGSENIATDIAELRAYITGGGFISKIIGLFGGAKRRRRRSDAADE